MAMDVNYDRTRRSVDEMNDDLPPRILPPVTAATARDLTRRRRISPIGFSHCAFRSADLEATRHFYEDVIGLPLIAADKIIQEPNPATGVLTDGIHLFFELADGSAIGFFGLDETAGEPHRLPHNGMEHHFAVQMEDEATIKDVEIRAKSNGFTCGTVDHGYCLSLYIDDPDGVLFELVYHRENWFADVDEKQARARMDEWISNGHRWAGQETVKEKIRS